MCDKRDWAITWVFCCYLHLTPMFSDPLQKDLSKGKWSLAKSCFKQNYCHACHTRFAVFLFLPSCCLSSILTLILSVPVQAPPSYVIFGLHGITPVIHCWISFLSTDVKPTQRHAWRGKQSACGASQQTCRTGRYNIDLYFLMLILGLIWLRTLFFHCCFVCLESRSVSQVFRR